MLMKRIVPLIACAAVATMVFAPGPLLAAGQAAVAASTLPSASGPGCAMSADQPAGHSMMMQGCGDMQAGRMMQAGMMQGGGMMMPGRGMMMQGRAKPTLVFGDLPLNTAFYFPADTNHTYLWTKISATSGSNTVNGKVVSIKAPTAVTSDKAVQYTCPMHPEVVQDKPGNCPKCGMKLQSSG